MKVAVIGGGISGLATAYRLKKMGVGVSLFEAGESVGGNIRTETRDGFLLENGPNSLLASRALLDLIDDLGITDQILKPSADGKTRYIVRGGRLRALPASPVGLIRSDAFSGKAKLGLLKEPFVRSRAAQNETVASFFGRRLGKEIADFAVDPFIAGIYAGDPNRLSIEQAFPKLFEFESKHGSLLKGAIRSRKPESEKLPPGFPRSFTFRDGMVTLVKAIAQDLGDAVRTGTRVHELSSSARGYSVRTDQGAEAFDAVVLSTPAKAAANLIRDLDNGLATSLENIYYPPIAVVYTGFRSEQIATPPRGFGFLVPSMEGSKILGSLFTSSLFEGRTPDGFHLFTTFVGGSRNADLCARPDKEVIDTAAGEISKLLGIKGEPTFRSIKKWERSIPQYNVGYEAVPQGIDAFREKHPAIFFCSNFYRGISVSDCVKNANETAGAVREILSTEKK